MELTNAELLEAVQQIEAMYEWNVETSVPFTYKRDCAQHIRHRADYMNAMKHIKNHLSYDEWMENYFSREVDLDRMLVFAVINLDLQDKVNSLQPFLCSYFKWYDYLVLFLDVDELQFLIRVWKSWNRC